MKRPRVTIGRLMAVVVFIAVNCGVMRSVWGTVGPLGIIVFGLMPMANLLAAGLIVALRRSWTSGGVRPSWVGFAVFGLAAMAAYAVLCLLDLVIGYLNVFVRPIEAIFQGGGPWMDVIVVLIGFPIMWAALALPQLAVALLGGWLWGRYRLVRREPRVPSDSLHPQVSA
jgi:hypothetical protein